MTPGAFFWWCIAAGFGGAIAIGLLGMALAFASFMVGSEAHWWRKKR